MRSNFDYNLDFTTGSQLSFDFLKKALQNFYAQNSPKNIGSSPDEKIKTTITNQVYMLLKTNFIHKERLQNLELPKYEELDSFVEKLQDTYTKYYHPNE